MVTSVSRCHLPSPSPVSAHLLTKVNVHFSHSGKFYHHWFLPLLSLCSRTGFLALAIFMVLPMFHHQNVPLGSLIHVPPLHLEWLFLLVWPQCRFSSQMCFSQNLGLQDLPLLVLLPCHLHTSYMTPATRQYPCAPGGLTNALGRQNLYSPNVRFRKVVCSLGSLHNLHSGWATELWQGSYGPRHQSSIVSKLSRYDLLFFTTV